jgi:hypothetical protein
LDEDPSAILAIGPRIRDDELNEAWPADLTSGGWVSPAERRSPIATLRLKDPRLLRRAHPVAISVQAASTFFRPGSVEGSASTSSLEGYQLGARGDPKFDVDVAEMMVDWPGGGRAERGATVGHSLADQPGHLDLLGRQPSEECTSQEKRGLQHEPCGRLWNEMLINLSSELAGDHNSP